MLEVRDIDVYYGDLQAVWEVSLDVKEGEVLTLIGPNGAGKTTILRTISGLLRPARGSITFNGSRLDKVAANKIVEMGISMVPEGRRLFAGMSVLENLELGSFTSKARREKEATIKLIYQAFPVLEARKYQLAGTLSGGEQQMLAIGRALMSRPKLLLLDEPSLGLAPLVVQVIFEVIKGINSQGVTILLVEQNVRIALELAHRAYIVESGRIAGHGTGKELLSEEHVKSAYLGISTGHEWS